MSAKIHIARAFGGDTEGGTYFTPEQFVRLVQNIWSLRATDLPLNTEAVEQKATIGASYDSAELNDLVSELEYQGFADLGLLANAKRSSVRLALERKKLRSAGDYEAADQIRADLIAAEDYYSDARVANV